MKIYSKVVFDIASGKQLSAESFDYDGEVAKCSSSPKAQKPSAFYPYSVDIVKPFAGQLGGAIQQDIITNPFLARSGEQYKRAVSDIRGGYGARGLEGSGIAIRGEQDALQKIVADTQAMRAGQLTDVLKTVSGAPSVSTPQQQQGRGFMGMK